MAGHVVSTSSPLEGWACKANREYNFRQPSLLAIERIPLASALNAHAVKLPFPLPCPVLKALPVETKASIRQFPLKTSYTVHYSSVVN